MLLLSLGTLSCRTPVQSVSYVGGWTVRPSVRPRSAFSWSWLSHRRRINFDFSFALARSLIRWAVFEQRPVRERISQSLAEISLERSVLSYFRLRRRQSLNAPEDFSSSRVVFNQLTNRSIFPVEDSRRFGRRPSGPRIQDLPRVSRWRSRFSRIKPWKR